MPIFKPTKPEVKLVKERIDFAAFITGVEVTIESGLFIAIETTVSGEDIISENADLIIKTKDFSLFFEAEILTVVQYYGLHGEGQTIKFKVNNVADQDPDLLQKATNLTRCEAFFSLLYYS